MVEQNVAPYAAQKITIGTQGIVLNGRLVTTHFNYDGARLEFTVNGSRISLRSCWRKSR